MLILWRRSPIQYVLLVGYATYSRNLLGQSKRPVLIFQLAFPAFKKDSLAFVSRI